MSQVTSIPTLPYADVASRWGVSCQRTAVGYRLVVPPVRSLGQLNKSYLWGLLPAVLFVLILLAGLLGPGGSDGMWPNLAVYGGVLLLIAWRAWLRFRRRIVFDVTAARFVVSFVTPSGRRQVRLDVPRDDVINVKFNPYDGRLLVQLRHRDLMELDVSRVAAVAEYVADELRRAVFQAQYEPDGRGAPALSSPNISRAGGLRIAKVVVLITAAVGGLMLFRGGSWAHAGVMVMFLGLALAGVFAGMALGEQDKEFWV